MHTDDVPVIGEDPPERRRQPRGRGGLVAFGALLAAVSMAAVGAGNESSEPAVALPEPEPVTTTTIDVPEVVDYTLTWDTTVGLEEAWRISEVLDLGESVLAVGTTEDGLAVWESDDGKVWGGAHQVSNYSGGSSVVGAIVASGKPVIVENFTEPAPGRPGATVWTMDRPGGWTGRELQPLGSAAVVQASGIGLAGQQIVVTGVSNWRRDPATALAALQPEVIALITTGQATLIVGVGNVGVLIEPNRLVYSTDFADEPEAVPMRSLSFLTWTGSTPAQMRLTGDQVVTEIVDSLSDGRLVGRAGNQLFVTSDGQTWTPLPESPPVRSPASWSQDLVALADDERSMFGVDIASGDAVVLSPPDGLVADKTRLSSLSANQAGIGVVALAPSRPEPDVHTVVGGDKDTIVQLVGHGGLEIHHRGEVVFDGTVHTAPISLEPDSGRLLFTDPIGGEPVLSLEVGQWLSGVDLHALVSRPRPAATVIHTPDGEVWSATPWSELGADIAPIEPEVVVGEEFVLAIDQGGKERPVSGVWVGRPSG